MPDIQSIVAASDKRAAAMEYAAEICRAGPTAAAAAVEPLKAASKDKKKAEVREAAMYAIEALGNRVSVPQYRAIEPYVMPLLTVAIECAADAKNVADAAAAAADALIHNANPTGVKNLLPPLFEALVPKNKWQSRLLALTLIGRLPDSAPKQTALALPDIIPKLGELMVDARKEVSSGAEQCLVKVCAVVGNKDIEPFIPTLASCIARPDEVTECVYKLAATTFVHAVEPPTLALMAPVLERGLKVTGLNSVSTRRACAVIIDNMCKMVEVPSYAAPFLPKLLPGLDRTKDEVADPEVRQVAAKAHVTLMKAAGGDNASSEGTPMSDPAKLAGYLTGFLGEKKLAAKDAGLYKPAFDYSITLACALTDSRMFEEDEWKKSIGSYLLPHLGGNSAMSAVNEAVLNFRAKCESEVVVKEIEVDDDVEPEICNCEFSLGYGAKILLNTARLALRRGRRYGLVGAKGVGKSTLMRSIANGQVEGFPDASQVRTVLVEHDIQGMGGGDDKDWSVIEYAQLDPRLSNFTQEEIWKSLTSVGFTDHMIKNSVTALSGGWKMKLSLARAILVKPDIMLLDEPTNHLDKINAAWVVNYLKNLKDVTCVLVSHDTGFLDNVCTDIIYMEKLKLKRYKGNLSEFVKNVPEAKTFYTLDATNVRFRFPEPGPLEGVNSKGKAIMKMAQVTYKYPTSDRWILQDITINVSLSSRVVVVGPNGAGKSTMIKLLTGEIANPQAGSVWRHPNVRIAYVAQHAFHHIEQHLDKTPNEYMQWRYCSGEDREAIKKEASIITAEDEKKMAEKVSIDGSKYVVEQVLNRRSGKHGYEYETKFVGMAADKNKWLPRKWLEENGFEKLVNQVDAREAAAAGLHSKPLTAANIAKHFAEVGLESEYTLHSRIRGLSGGQKVKLVLGAAMWNNPHMLVLDEPTNNLDRDSLGALAAAVRDFGGGVILITHNAEFANHICIETWLIDSGRINISGESWTRDEKIAKKEGADEVIDAAGNVIKVQKEVKKKSSSELSKAEKKKIMKTRLARIKKGEDVSDEEEWMAEFMGEVA